MARMDQIVRVPLHIGLDTYNDPKQARGLSISRNVYSDRGNEVRTRKGLAAFTSSRTTQGGNRAAGLHVLVAGTGLIPAGGQPLVIGRDKYSRDVNGVNCEVADSGGGAYLPVDTSADTDWEAIAVHSHFSLTHRSAAAADGLSERAVSYAKHGDYELFVWTADVGGTDYAHYSIRNTATGAWVKEKGDVLSSVAAGKQLVAGCCKDASGNWRFVVFVEDVGGSSYLITLVPETGVRTTQTLSGADPALATFYKDKNNETWITVASYNGVSSKLRLWKYNASAQIAAEDTDQDVTPVAVTMLWHPSTPYIAVLDTNDDLHVFSNTLTDGMSPKDTLAVTMPANPINIGLAGASHDLVANSGSTGHFSWIITATEIYNTVLKDCIPAVHTSKGTFNSSTDTLVEEETGAYAWGEAASVPFVMNARWFLPVVLNNTSDDASAAAASLYAHGRLVLMELRNMDSKLYWHPAAHLKSSDVREFDYTDGTRRSLHEVSWSDLSSTQTQFNIPIQVFKRVISSYGPDGDPQSFVVKYGVDVIELDTACLPPQYVESGDDLIIGGPLIKHFDGFLQEVGFLAHPEITEVNTPAGGALPAGTYSMRYVWEWTDRFGNVHQSAPSDSMAEEAALNDKFQAAILSDVPTTTHERIRTSFPTAGLVTKRYATVCVPYMTNPAVDANLHRRALAAPTGLVIGSQTSPEFNHNGELTTLGLSNQELLYTDGGELPNVAPPSSNILLAHKDRVFLVPDENKTQLWYSKKRVRKVGLSFAAALYMDLQQGGDITGLAGLDDYVVVFHANSIQVFGGDGPNALGLGAAFTDPVSVSKSIGCRDPNSVVSFGDGVVFKSDRGFMLLDRSLAVTPIGHAVRDWDDYTCHRAIHVPPLGELRFLHKDYSGGSDTVLVFDYENKAWRELILDNVIADIACVDGVPMLLTTVVADSVFVYAESADECEATVILQTPWVHLAGMQDFQRVRECHIIGEWPSAGTLTVTFYKDYDDTLVHNVSVNLANVASDGIIRIKPQVRRGKAVRVKLTYTNGGGEGETGEVRISEVALQIMPKPGKMGRVKADATY